MKNKYLHWDHEPNDILSERGCVRSTSRSAFAFRRASDPFSRAPRCGTAAAGPLDTAALRRFMENIISRSRGAGARRSFKFSFLCFLVALLAVGCVTRRQVAEIVSDSNAAILATQMGVEVELAPNPATAAPTDDVARKIDAFIAAHPEQKATASALRIRQAVFYLSQKKYDLAQAAFDVAMLQDLHSDRDRALKELSPHIVWWYKTAPRALQRPELRNELPNANKALVAFQEQIQKRADSPDTRDFLAEMRAWIGLKFAEAGNTSKQIGQRLGAVANDYAGIFDDADLAWFADPRGTPGKEATATQIRRRLRAKAIFKDAMNQLQQLDAQDRPVIDERAKRILESRFITENP